MNAPPEAFSSGPKRKTNWILISIIGGLGCCCGAPALIFPAILQFRTKARTGVSVKHLTTLTTGLLLYASDNNDTFPAADRWQDSVETLVPDKSAFRLGTRRVGITETDFAFVEAWSRRKLSSIARPSTTILLFSSSLGSRNAHGGFNSVFSIRQIGDQAFFGFADGRAKGVKAKEVQGLIAVQPR